MRTEASTATIVLNSVGLTIDEDSVTVMEEGGSEALPIGSIVLDPDLDFLYINLDGVQLVQGLKYDVHIQFNGTLRTPLQGSGLYYDLYQQDGETR